MKIVKSYENNLQLVVVLCGAVSAVVCY